MLIDANGIDLNNWNKILDKGEKAVPSTFFEHIKNLNLRNSIFVDNTANEDIAYLPTLFKSSISLLHVIKLLQLKPTNITVILSNWRELTMLLIYLKQMLVLAFQLSTP